MIEIPEVVSDVWKASVFLGKENQIVQDNHGNISAIVGDPKLLGSTKEMFIKPSGLSFADMDHRPDDWCRIQFNDDGDCWQMDHGSNLSQRDGRHPLKPSVDTSHHTRIYLASDKIGGICHTHSPYATAWAMNRTDIPCMSTMHADYFGGEIICVGSGEEGPDDWSENVCDQIYEQRDPPRALLLSNHGVLTFGKTAMEAAKRAVQLELVARQAYMTAALHANIWGMNVKRIKMNEDVVSIWHERYEHGYGQRSKA